MLIVRQPEAIAQIPHAAIRRRIEYRFQELFKEYGQDWSADELGWFIVWGIGDDPYDPVPIRGFRPLLVSSDGQRRYGEPGYRHGFEAVEDHGECFELVMVLTDLVSICIFVPKVQGIHPDVIRAATALSNQEEQQ
ncbi:MULTISPECIES: hypothetical protein [Cupriavidus]